MVENGIQHNFKASFHGQIEPKKALPYIQKVNILGKMKFEWDEPKRKLNLKNHGIDFEDITSIFDAPMLTALDSREDYGEDRWVGIGIVRNIVLVIVFTERGHDKIRIISARKATKNERQAFDKEIKDQLG